MLCSSSHLVIVLYCTSVLSIAVYFDTRQQHYHPLLLHLLTTWLLAFSTFYNYYHRYPYRYCVCSKCHLHVTCNYCVCYANQTYVSVDQQTKWDLLLEVQVELDDDSVHECRRMHLQFANQSLRSFCADEDDLPCWSFTNVHGVCDVPP